MATLLSYSILHRGQYNIMPKIADTTHLHIIDSQLMLKQALYEISCNKNIARHK